MASAKGRGPSHCLVWRTMTAKAICPEEHQGSFTLAVGSLTPNNLDITWATSINWESQTVNIKKQDRESLCWHVDKPKWGKAGTMHNQEGDRKKVGWMLCGVKIREKRTPA